MHLKKSSKTNTYVYLQHLTTALWTCSTAPALLVLGMKMEIIYIHSFIIQVCRFCSKILFNHVHAYFFGISFTCMVFKIILTFFCRQKPCLPPANEKNFLWIFKKARLGRHFWAFGLSLKEHCFHQLESNLKTRHYEYASDFEGYWYFIYSFVSMI